MTHLVVSVEAVSEVSTAREVESHDAVVGIQKRGIDGKIRRRAGVRLYVDTPFFRVQAIRSKSALLAHDLHLVDDLISTIVARTRVTFRILVREG